LYQRLRLLEGKYEQEGVPVVNTIDSLSNSIKSRALEIIGRTGVRTARAVQVDEAWSYDAIVSRVGSPFIIRNDQGHGGYASLIGSYEEFRGIAWGRLSHPLALEFIDTRSEDGLYRKYRYILMGDAGLFRHLLITTSWCAHARDRVRGDAYIKEEMDVMDQACPYHDKLNTARKALGMDYVAFDYSVDRQGGLVVWEPNPFPTLWSRHSARDSYAGYQKAHVGRVCTHLLGYYLNQAGIPVDT
ncbi:MAG TPA: hypothetical protein VFG50_03520, partial [Rhodothermales bacterium]|nr:hypothetical protein [Rhodothermales bacterium]